MIKVVDNTVVKTGDIPLASAAKLNFYRVTRSLDSGSRVKVDHIIFIGYGANDYVKASYSDLNDVCWINQSAAEEKIFVDPNPLDVEIIVK